MATECAREVEAAASRLRRRFRRPAAYKHAVDYLRGLVAEVERKNGWHLAEHAVLVVDETAFPKQGRHAAGVARHYCGTLGQRANCQVGVFLGYASPTGHVGLDRVLYLPHEWTDARARCQQAGIPDEVPFRVVSAMSCRFIPAASRSPSASARAAASAYRAMPYSDWVTESCSSWPAALAARGPLCPVPARTGGHSR